MIVDVFIHTVEEIFVFYFCIQIVFFLLNFSNVNRLLILFHSQIIFGVRILISAHL